MKREKGLSKERIIELAAKAAGDYSGHDYWAMFTEELQEFARLVEQETLE